MAMMQTDLGAELAEEFDVEALRQIRRHAWKAEFLLEAQGTHGLHEQDRKRFLALAVALDDFLIRLPVERLA